MKSTIADAIKSIFLNEESVFENVNEIWSSTSFDGKHSSTTLWDSTDTEKQYNLNGNKKYSKTSIKYHFNEFGYRIQKPEDVVSDSETPVVACFGCSQTFGVGVNYEETWPYFLQQKIGKNVCFKNYGVSGASADTIARLIHNYLLAYKPTAICCLLPDIFRRELYEYLSENIYPRNFFRWTEEEEKHVATICKEYELNLLDWKSYKRFSEEDNSLYNFIKNIKFIESVCLVKNVPLKIFTWDPHVLSLMYNKQFSSANIINFIEEDYVHLENWEKMEKARDNIHLGVEPNERFADVFYREIKSLIC